MVLVVQDAAEQSNPPEVQADEPPIPSGCPTPLSAVDLAVILANPEDFGLATGVWYALDAPAWLVANRPAHTLAGRLDVSAERIMELAETAHLNKRAAAVTRVLAFKRSRASVLPVSIQRLTLGSTRIRCAPTIEPHTLQNALHARERQPTPTQDQMHACAASITCPSGEGCSLTPMRGCGAPQADPAGRRWRADRRE